MIENVYLVSGSVVLIVIFLVALRFFQRRVPKELNRDYFQLRWKNLQKMCGDKKTWPLAIIDADKLLDEALKKSRVKGKTMGERLVTAQHNLTNNDGVWYAHKLRNRLVHEQMTALKETDVKEALVGFRQALKDLGAIK